MLLAAGACWAWQGAAEESSGPAALNAGTCPEGHPCFVDSQVACMQDRQGCSSRHEATLPACGSAELWLTGAKPLALVISARAPHCSKTSMVLS